MTSDWKSSHKEPTSRWRSLSCHRCREILSLWQYRSVLKAAAGEAVSRLCESRQTSLPQSMLLHFLVRGVKQLTRPVWTTYWTPTNPKPPSIYYRISHHLYNHNQQTDRESITSKTQHLTSAPRPHRRGMFFLGA